MIENRRKQLIRNCTGPDCEIENSHKKRAFSRFIFYFLVAAFFGTLIYIVFYSPYLRITNIDIEGNSEIPLDSIEENFDRTLAGKYLGFIPKNNFIFIFPGRMERDFKNEFKKIKSINFQKKFPDTINVKMEEYSALLVWCVSEQCYMIDENGVAYWQVDFNSPQVVQNHLIRINDLSGQFIELGSQVIDADYASYIMSLKDSLAKSGITLSEDSYQTPSRMAEEIDVKSVSGTQLLFSTHYSQESAIKALALILKKQITPELQGSVAYIDLRSEGKAFYKMSGETAQISAENGEEKAAKDKSKEDDKKSSDKKK